MFSDRGLILRIADDDSPGKYKDKKRFYQQRNNPAFLFTFKIEAI